MLRFLLKISFLLWAFAVMMLLAVLHLGKSAPAISHIAFFSQEMLSTAYWQLDLWTGVALKTDYAGRLLTPDNGQSPVEHFLLISSDSDFSTIFEMLPNQELSFIWSYTTRHHEVRLAGDYIFLMDYANQWSQLRLPGNQFRDIGEFANIGSLQASPDGQWLAMDRLYDNQWFFINLLNGDRYGIEGYFQVYWSPDSQWYITDTTENISVHSAQDGSPHPNLPASFPAYNVSWAADGQSLFYLEAGRLTSVSLADGQISEYPMEIDYFDPSCLAPNQEYLLFGDGNLESLVALETGEIIWQIEDESIVVVDCLWSEDSRYLVSYYTVFDFGTNFSREYWQRFFVIDTQTGTSWDLYPEMLPSAPLYPHIPD